jgi:hypothetical protein
MLSQELLKQLLSYCPETGEFRWRVDRNQHVASGDVAGRVGKSGRLKGYRRITVGGRKYLSGRLAHFYMTGEWPTDQIDHIDRNPSNDAWGNLRSVSQSLNKRNTGAYRNNKSGVMGVYLDKRCWVANIYREENLQVEVYRGPSLFEAVCARKSAEREFYVETRKA